MNEYIVYYDKDGPDEINYGSYYAKNEIEAIEQIIAHDTIRKQYSLIEEPEIRHQGMTAKFKKTDVLYGEKEKSITDMMKDTEQNISSMQKDFNDLEEKYLKTLEELKQHKTARAFGATFHYHNHEDKFLPIFVLDDSIVIDGEYPYKYTLNFDKELLSFWLAKCGENIREV